MFIVITGGSASGKSEYAENLAVSLKKEKKYYIATMFPYDEESRQRISRHKFMRESKKFETIECFYNIKDLNLPKKRMVILECMSNLAANEMYMPMGSGKGVKEEIIKGVEILKNQCTDLIIVTNEVFSDGLYYEKETREYIENLGYINQLIAAMADCVIEVVYSIPIILKGGIR